MMHFNHPRELTDVAVRGIDALHRAGVITVNQTPLIKGVNDDSETLHELFQKLASIGAPPYYVFICRPTLGNEGYAVPVETALQVFTKARETSSGLAKRARLTMSHVEGKIEVLGMTDEEIYFKFHRAAHPEDNAKMIIAERNPEACWFDDYVILSEHVWAPSLIPIVIN
jgi:L-lysine 2,3-aminomutase